MSSLDLEEAELRSQLAALDAEEAASKAAQVEKKAIRGAVREREGISRRVLSEVEKEQSTYLQDERPVAEKDLRKIEGGWKKDEAAAKAKSLFGIPMPEFLPIGSPTAEASEAQARLPRHKEDWQSRRSSLDAADLEGARRDKDISALRETHQRDVELSSALDAMEYQRLGEELGLAPAGQSVPPGSSPGPQSAPAPTPIAQSRAGAQDPSNLSEQDVAAPPIQPAAVATPKSFDKSQWDDADKAAWKALPVEDKKTFVAQAQRTSLEREVMAKRRAIADRPLPDFDPATVPPEERKRRIERIQSRKDAELRAFDETQRQMSPDRAAIIDSAAGIAPGNEVEQFGREISGRTKTALAAAGQAYASVGTGVLDLATAAQAAFGADPADTWTKQFADGVRQFYDNAQDDEYRDAVATKLTSGLASAHSFMAPGAGVGKLAAVTGAGAKAGGIISALPFVTKGKTAAQIAEVGSMTLGASITGAIVNGGASYSEALEMGMTQPEAFTRLAAGVGLGMTEAVGVGGILAKLDKLSRGSVGKFFRNLATQGAEEGGQEAFQSAAQDLADRWILGKEDSRTKQFERIKADAIEAGLWGAVTGILFTGLVDVAQRRDLRNRSVAAESGIRELRNQAKQESPEASAADVAKKVNAGLMDSDTEVAALRARADELRFSGLPSAEASDAAKQIADELKDIEAKIAAKTVTPEQVRLAAEITPGFSGVLNLVDSEIQAAEMELSQFNGREGILSPTDFDARLKAQEKLASALSRKVESARRLQGADVAARISQAQEISAYADAPADPNGNGRGNGSSQRQIVLAIAKAANGIELTDADINLRGANGRPIFNRDKKTGRVALTNPETSDSLQKSAPAVFSAWQAFERSQAAPAPETQLPVGAESGIGDFNREELAGKTAAELSEIAQRVGVDVAVQSGELPLTAAEIADRILAKAAEANVAPAEPASDERFAPTQVPAQPADIEPAHTPETLEGEKINREWTAFAEDSGSLGIPRADMPQIRAEHRGALVQFLKARDITHTQEEVLPGSLKPTQAEYSEAKVQKARTFEGGDRAILVSEEGNVVDGHHQWMAKLHDSPAEPMRVIRLNAPIRDLLPQIAEFPSSTPSKGAGDKGPTDVQSEVTVPDKSSPAQSAPAPRARTLAESIRDKDKVQFHGMTGFLRQDEDGTVLFRKQGTQEVYEVAPAALDRTVDDVEALTVSRIGKRRTSSPKDAIEPNLDLASAREYAVSVGASNVEEAADGIARTLTRRKDRRLSRPYRERDSQSLREKGSAGLPGGTGPEGAGSTRGRSERLSGNETAAALSLDDTAAITRGFAAGERISSIVPDLVSREIPVFDITGKTIKSPADFAMLAQAVRSPYFESLKVAFLDDGGKVVHSQVLFVGTLNEAVAHPRDILQSLRVAAGKTKARRVIISHNHPSGDPSPSDPDVRLQDRFEVLFDTLGIEMVDHVITNGARYYSFLGQGIGNIDAPLAAWEAISREALPPSSGSSSAFSSLIKNLRQADPGSSHIIYVNTKFQVTGVERAALGDVKAWQNAIAEGVAREGAFGFFLDVAPDQSTSQAAEIVRAAERLAKLMNVKLFDASWTGVESAREASLLSEAPTAYSDASRFSLSEGSGSLPPRAVRDAGRVVDAMRAKLPGIPAVQIVFRSDSAEIADGSVPADRIEGMFDPATPDEVTIFPENIRLRAGETPVQAIQRVVLHEAIGHRGVRGVLGTRYTERLENLLQRIQARQPGFLQGIYVRRPDLSPDPRDNEKVQTQKRIVAFEEWLAESAENPARLELGKRNIFRRVVAAIVDFIDQALGYRISERSAIVLLRQAGRYTRPASGQSPAALLSESKPSRIRFSFAGDETASMGGTYSAAADSIASDIRAGKPEAEMERNATAAMSGEKSPNVLTAAINIVKRELVPMGGVPREAAALIHETRVADAYGRKIGLDWGKLLDNGDGSSILGFQAPAGGVTEADRLAMFEYLNGDQAAGQELNPELKAISDRARNVIDNLGQRAVNAGLMNPETFERNKGAYLPRLYRPKELAERGLLGVGRKFMTMILDRTGKPRLSDAYAIIDSRGNPVSHDERGNFRFESEHARDVFYDQLMNREVLSDLRKQGGVGALQESDIANPSRLAESLQTRIRVLKGDHMRRYEKNNPWSDATLTRMGLIRQPGYPAAKAIVQLSHDIALANLFRQFAANPEWVSDLGRPGFVQIANNPRWGALSGKHVQSSIARELNEMANAPGMAVSLYDGAMMHWKKWKTVYNPATHGRNVLGNAMFADLAGVDVLNPLNWRYYVEMVHTLRGNGKRVTLDELHREGVLSGDFTLNELREVLDSSVTEGLLPENMASKAFGFITLRGVRKLAERAYRLEDEMFKVAAYLKARDRGMTPKESAAHVRTWFPSYDHIPKSSTMAAAKRVFPFVSFFYEALRIAGNAVAHPVKQPVQALKFAKWMSIPSLITLWSLARLGLDDDDEKAVLEEMRGKLGGWPVFSALMPFTDSEGRPTQWDLTNIIPYANVLGLRLDRSDEEPLWQDMIRTVLTSNPVGDIGVSLATNEDQFTGQELIVPGMSSTESAAEIAKFLGKKILPPITPLAGTTWNTLTAPQRSRGTLQKRDQGQAVARALLGVDLRNTEPSIWRAIEKFQIKNGYGERAEGWGETATSRGRNRLYEALINDDVPSLSNELAALEAKGITFETDKAVKDWLRARHPITGSGRIKVADKEAFLDSLSPMQRAAVERAEEEFERISETAPDVFSEAEAERR